MFSGTYLFFFFGDLMLFLCGCICLFFTSPTSAKYQVVNQIKIIFFPNIIIETYRKESKDSPKPGENEEVCVWGGVEKVEQ